MGSCPTIRRPCCQETQHWQSPGRTYCPQNRRLPWTPLEHPGSPVWSGESCSVNHQRGPAQAGPTLAQTNALLPELLLPAHLVSTGRTGRRAPHPGTCSPKGGERRATTDLHPRCPCCRSTPLRCSTTAIRRKGAPRIAGTWVWKWQREHCQGAAGPSAQRTAAPGLQARAVRQPPRREHARWQRSYERCRGDAEVTQPAISIHGTPVGAGASVVTLVLEDHGQSSVPLTHLP